MKHLPDVHLGQHVIFTDERGAHYKGTVIKVDQDPFDSLQIRLSSGQVKIRRKSWYSDKYSGWTFDDEFAEINGLLGRVSDLEKYVTKNKTPESARKKKRGMDDVEVGDRVIVTDSWEAEKPDRVQCIHVAKGGSTSDLIFFAEMPGFLLRGWFKDSGYGWRFDESEEGSHE